MSANPTIPSGGGKLPLHFDATIGVSDLPDPKLIGSISGGFSVFLVIVNVTVAFNGVFSMTVGDDISQGNLISVSDVFMDSVGIYSIEVNQKYTSKTDIKAFFLGNPSTGSASISVFYQ